MIPACSCCSRIVTEDEITPDGCHIFGERSLVSFKCPCGTNRTLRFEDVSPALRQQAHLAELARK